MSRDKSWKEWLNLDPLYIPLFTAGPVDIWLLFKQPPYQSVEITLYIIAILFLVFSGAVETYQEETKHRVIGYISLISALVFGIIGLVMWLGPI